MRSRRFSANRADLEAIKLRQRILVDVSNRSTATTILGEPASLPLALAPIGLCGMQHGDGEILACRAAQAAGIPFTLSTMSICSIEDVAAAVDKPFWFQLYVMKDRGFVRALIERAAAAKCSALVLTVDLQILGQRHRDIKNGMTVPPQWRIGNFIDMASKPAWLLERRPRQAQDLRQSRRPYPRHGERQFAVALDLRSVRRDVELEGRRVDRQPVARQAHPQGHPRRRGCAHAAKTGAAALVVSNHGGRQLDGAPSSIAALPPIVEAVGSSIEVLFDGGIRSGQDVMRAIALGARACLSGRAYIYGLGAGGQAGVDARDRDHPQRAQRQHGADRRQQHRGNRSQRDREPSLTREAGVMGCAATKPPDLRHELMQKSCIRFLLRDCCSWCATTAVSFWRGMGRCGTLFLATSDACGRHAGRVKRARRLGRCRVQEREPASLLPVRSAPSPAV